MYPKITQIILILIFSPLLFGIINRTKAFFAGRHGAPLLQMYYDILKLLRKGAVYSTTVTWIFIAGPLVNVSVFLCALALIPFGGHPALIAFEGDIILFIYMLGLARFFIVLAAMDAGSSFEGMGASREVQFAVFAEPALFISLIALARATGETSLSAIFSKISLSAFLSYGPAFILSIGALFIVFLTENSRIPVDDPNTHLELTMIHEVMVLDHSGVDLAHILYGATLKFWIMGTLMAAVLMGTRSYGLFIDYTLFIVGMIVFAIIVGIVESILARLRLLQIPHFLIVALALSILALTFSMR